MWSLSTSLLDYLVSPQSLLLTFEREFFFLVFSLAGVAILVVCFVEIALEHIQGLVGYYWYEATALL